ncbi:glycosyltransferase family 2 protein [Calocera cornea HHB12733]|uniref:chitin synthase n=1 Tax=Calocera cornea HHB12733 TaxID=1353952 RepID=A0A165D045_9BASI|nr:glycosyltransferase family 2 protein [Calocera cornea HHB12733]
MEDRRPPRAAPPPSTSYSTSQSPPPSYSNPFQSPSRPSLQPASSVSFQANERGDRAGPVRTGLQSGTAQYVPGAHHTGGPPPPTSVLPAGTDEDVVLVPSGGLSDSNDGMRRKKSLVRPERERIGPDHRQWNYRMHAAQMETEGTGRVGVFPSNTGNYPHVPGLRRGKSLLAREEDVQESGLALFKRNATTLRRKRQPQTSRVAAASPIQQEKSTKPGFWDGIAPGPKDGWMIYCWILTCFVPGPLLSACGIRTPEQKRAWREKMGLLAIIASIMAAVGFLTFGFTQTVCGKPPQRYLSGTIDVASLIIHGYDYDFSHFKHPAVAPFFNGTQNPLYVEPWMAEGMDASFLFQNVNLNCKGLITAASGSAINTSGTGSTADLGWYFPCNLYDQWGTTPVNKTGYTDSTLCHATSTSRSQFASIQPQGQVYYTWQNISNTSRNLAVFEQSVLDLDLLQWLDKSQVNYPSIFDELKNKNGTFNGRDITMFMYRAGLKDIATCLQDTVLVGFVDSMTIGCVASEVVLYVSLVFIIGVVAIRFALAVLFGWFVSWRIGSFRGETYEQRMRRAAEIEQWTDDIYRAAPARYRPNVLHSNKANRKTQFLPSTSRFSKADALKGAGSRPTTMYAPGNVDYRRQTTMSTYGMMKTPGFTPPDTPFNYPANSRSSTSLPFGEGSSGRHSISDPSINACPFPLHNVIPQPSPDYEPFNFPLAHTICLVTAYSESVEGLRTTLDSLATTDYPNSHKLLLVIADGTVFGADNALSTPEIVLSMMHEFIIPKDEVEPHSYVAIADGHKRHNMAKVYAGFYDYDDNTVEKSKQQRVPIILVHKCGNPLEQRDPKPGNRGKRDSQIVLMSFLQKVMFDERMTTFEYEFFNSIWRVTGISPDRYEIVLCVDADTKVFPDSVTRMVSCMVYDEDIMGLCGETKIANKAETWVTMIQVFEYYISHHLTKAFESMFGGVTCLPGCFSMYRIKAPKANTGYWVPIIANPDIVEHYSENVVDTLHKKNLLLLGEDRYLTTLMLKTFPKRKMIFCPQAVCKTIVPDTFRVLLSQRRRWINSTIHNLAELLLVRDLCGTFCFSMQFVVFMELTGTLVLPAAISFTIYLIVIACIPSQPTPTIPLILLAIILGLPGILIVVTSRKVAYVGWMLIYLFSLPIWNFVLPAYAFWHFDDFSWGQTRMVKGEVKGGKHGDKEGEFDSSHIVMKRWAEFERERRWKNGTYSRDSTYYDAPRRTDSNRYSIGSTSETYFSGNTDAMLSRQSQPLSQVASAYDSPEPRYDRPRVDSTPLLMLPAPLSVSQSRPPPRDASPASSKSADISRSTEDDDAEPILHSSPEPVQYLNPQYMGPGLGGPSAVVRQGTVPTVAYPGETQNPYRHSQPQAAVGYEASPYQYEAEEDYPPPPPPRPAQLHGRGVSLVDHGPVPAGGDGVRRVTRPARKSTSGAMSPSSTSTASTQQTVMSPDRKRKSLSSFSSGSAPAAGLPPGAAPPQPYNYQRY